MKKTPRSDSDVRYDASVPLCSIAGAPMARSGTPSAVAMRCASVVLPMPGGPEKSTWSSASPRRWAAATKTLRFSTTFDWPTYSSKLRGRSAGGLGLGLGGGAFVVLLAHGSTLPCEPLLGEDAQRCFDELGDAGAGM